jgi:hypothetical protein
MDRHTHDTIAEIGLRLVDALHELTEELRELRKEHTALRQQVEHIQEAVSCAAGADVSFAASRPPPVPGGTPSPVAALRRRYGELFDAGEFRQAARVYAALLAAEAQVCRCGHGYRHHDTKHGGCRVCPCDGFQARPPEEAP